MDQGPKIRPKTLKLLEKNIRVTLFLAMIFLDSTPKVNATKAKINKLDYIEPRCEFLYNFHLTLNTQSNTRKRILCGSKENVV